MLDEEAVLRLLTSTDCLFSTDVLMREASVEALGNVCKHWTAREIMLVLVPSMLDIDARLHTRTGLSDDRRESGTEAVLGYPDAEGWGTLETSVKAVRVVLSALTSLRTDLVVPLHDCLEKLLNHTNRFAREQAQYCLSEFIRLTPDLDLEDGARSLFIGWIAGGLQDNWSQVRYAALTATRVLVRSCILLNCTDILNEDIVPLLLLNRHFVAEGVKRFSQETWKMLVGPQGGAGRVASARHSVLTYLSTSVDSPNHSVREAVACCMSELLTKVLPVHCAETLTTHDVATILRVCITSIEDDTWPVRDIGATCTLAFYTGLFPLVSVDSKSLMLSKIGHIVDLLQSDVFDPMLPLRCSASEAVGYLAALECRESPGSRILWRHVVSLLVDSIPACKNRTPAQSGASVVLGSGSDTAHENRPMYSCGSLINNSSIRKVRHSASDDCCSAGHCDIPASAQGWEITDGAVRLFGSLMKSEILGQTEIDELLTACLPVVVEAFLCDGYAKQSSVRNLILLTVEEALQYLKILDERLPPYLAKLLVLTEAEGDELDHTIKSRCASVLTRFIA